MLRCALIALFVLSSVVAAAAQDAQGRPRTTADTNISLEHVALLCKPLTRGELEFEAEAWKSLLRQKAQDISDSRIALGSATTESFYRRLDPAGRAEGDEKTKLQQRATGAAAVEKKRLDALIADGMSKERPAIIERLQVVLAALRDKGGKSDDYDSYIAAVSRDDVLSRPTASTDPKAPQPKTTTTADIAPADLAVLCVPMSKAELEVEAGGWLAMLKTVAQQITDTTLTLRAAKDEAAKRKALDALAPLVHDKRPALIARLNVVLAAIRAKGGKTDEMESYVKVVSTPDGSGIPAEPPKAKTITNPKISASSLELLCKPLSKAELDVEAAAWLGLVQAKIQEVTDKTLAAERATAEEFLKQLDPMGRAEGDEKTKLLAKAAEQASAAKSQLQEEAAKAVNEDRPQLVDRLKVVLDALRAKGGKPDDIDTYINAVSGVTVKVDVTDASATWTFVYGWLKSPEGGIRYLKNVVFFVLTLVVFRVISSIVASLLSRGLARVKTLSNLLRDFVINTSQKVVFFVGFVIALSYLEVNIGPFLAAMGAAGFVIGFALQGTLSNFAAGVMILLYRPYDLGDNVTVAGNTGKVTAMTLVSTELRNADAHVVVIPNSSIWGGTITNLSAK
ncbi:MAG: mechanosensitive ion channel family protein [Phycisphaerae bacterium]